MARAVGINHLAIEVGSLDEALEFYGRLFELYGDVQFTKAPEILRGMGLELEKTESALQELRAKGLA